MKVRFMEKTCTETGAALTDEDFLRIAMQAAQEAIEDVHMPFGTWSSMRGGSGFIPLTIRVNTSMERPRMPKCQPSERPGESFAHPIFKAVCSTQSASRARCGLARVYGPTWFELSTPRVMKTAQHPPSTYFQLQMKQLSKSGVEIVGNVLRDESLKLFTPWSVAHRLDGFR